MKYHLQRLIATLLLVFLIQYVSFAQVRADSTEPLTAGTTIRLQSHILNERRVINIAFPSGYREHDTTAYPVIYLLDGGAEEDFFHIAGLVRYFSQPWISGFPQSIVVGVESGGARQRDFTFPVADLSFVQSMGIDSGRFKAYGQSAAFIAFIEQELQPFVAATYRGDNSKATIVGESLGGLLATEMLLKHHSMFRNYIIISPSLWWGNEALLNGAAGDLVRITGKVKVYVGAPAKDEEPRMYNDALALSEAIKKHSRSATVHFGYLPEETHATVIHQAVYNAFKWMYRGEK